MADAYKLLKDTSLPRAIRQADEFVDGVKVYETVGQAYRAGQVVFESEITPTLREEIAKGDLGWSEILEPIDKKEAAQIRWDDDRLGTHGTFIPEHEAEREIMADYGHEVIDRSVLIENDPKGAKAAREAQDATRKDGSAARPGLEQHAKNLEKSSGRTKAAAGRARKASK